MIEPRYNIVLTKKIEKYAMIIKRKKKQTLTQVLILINDNIPKGYDAEIITIK